MTFEQLRRLIPKRQTERAAYLAGYDAGRYGATPENSIFSFFVRPELTAAWERGHRDGRNARGLDR